MSSNVNISLAIANIQATSIAASFNSGYIDIYATSQPSSPETAPGGTALVTLPLPSSFAASINNGVITANTISPGFISNSGTAVWFRVTQSDHSTPIYDGLCGTSASDMNLATLTFTASVQFSITAFTFTIPGV